MSDDTLRATQEDAREVDTEQRPVATCGYFDREMGATECLYTHVVIGGKEYPRIRLGDYREVEAGFSKPQVLREWGGLRVHYSNRRDASHRLRPRDVPML